MKKQLVIFLMFVLILPSFAVVVGLDSGGTRATAGFWDESEKYSDDNNLISTEAVDLDPGGTGTISKYAVVVGISDYKYMSDDNDLEYADDDGALWTSFLESLGYTVYWLGGENDQRNSDTATETHIKQKINYVTGILEAGDIFVLVLSGHGGKNVFGKTYYCTFEYIWGLDGRFYEGEIANEMDDFATGVHRFLFMDYCYSGGVGDNLMALSCKSYIYCTTTCTKDGYGYESSTYKNGYWTEFFLDRYLEHNPSWTMEYTFDVASAAYPKSGDDAPQEFDGSSNSNFRL